MIEFNKNMLQLIYDLGIKQGDLMPELKEIIEAGIIQKDGCWFLAKFGKSNHEAPSTDKTGKECFVNKVHIDTRDFYEPSKLRQQGFLFIESLRKLLEPIGIFKIILNFSYIDSQSDRMACTVCFHKVRQNESWLEENLEDYKMNALLVFTTDNKQHHMHAAIETLDKKNIN